MEILSAQTGDINLEVQYVAAEDSDDDNSLGEDLYGFRLEAYILKQAQKSWQVTRIIKINYIFLFRYRFFDDEVLEGTEQINLHPLQNGYLNNQNNNNNCALMATPTAPRTPESLNLQSR